MLTEAEPVPGGSFAGEVLVVPPRDARPRDLAIEIRVLRDARQGGQRVRTQVRRIRHSIALPATPGEPLSFRVPIPEEFPPPSRVAFNHVWWELSVFLPVYARAAKATITFDVP